MILENKTAIIIVNYQTPWHLNECLKSVYTNTEINTFKIFVVHNKPDKKSIQVTQKFEKKYPGTMRVFRNETNIGFVAGINTAYEEAKEYYRVCFLNSDILVTKNWLSVLNGFLDSDSSIAQISPDVNHNYEQGFAIKLTKKLSNTFKLGIFKEIYKQALISSAVKGNRKGFNEYKDFWGFCTGACNVSRMEYFVERGYFFDPNIIHGYGDDFDTSYYLKQFGKIGTTDESYVIHFVNTSINKINKLRSDLKQQLERLNTLYLVMKWEERLDNDIQKYEPEVIKHIESIENIVKYYKEFKDLVSKDPNFKKYISTIPAKGIWKQLVS
jgi:GT2 family glycosyltransferase